MQSLIRVNQQGLQAEGAQRGPVLVGIFFTNYTLGFVLVLVLPQ